ncbi:MAG: RtcB family protein [Pirellula sp.]
MKVRLINQKTPREIKDEKIHAWTCDRLSDAVSSQVQRLARLDDAFRVAIMPDVQPGNRIPNGCVLATTHRIYPEAIGRDIGCGFSAVCFDIQSHTISQSVLVSILSHLERLVPSLMQPSPLAAKAFPQACCAEQLSNSALAKQAAREGLLQLGTLGRGNHFIELEVDQAGCLWGLVHSGSRSMGQAITDWHLRNTRRDEIDYLELATDNGQAYFSDMQWAMRYASENRLRMLNHLADSLDDLLNASPIESSYIDSPHNFARIEHHFGHELIVHRKSANSARKGEVAIIPGSMVSGSRIVVGKGNPQSLCSSSHGAGRTMSRSEAFGKLQVKDFKAIMGSIVYPKEHARRLLDESPAVYRSLSQVMQAQQDLVSTRDTLRTILCYKTS